MYNSIITFVYSDRFMLGIWYQCIMTLARYTLDGTVRRVIRSCLRIAGFKRHIAELQGGAHAQPVDSFTIHTAHMSPAFNGISAIQRFEEMEIRNGIIFDFYMTLSDIPSIFCSNVRAPVAQW